MKLFGMAAGNIVEKEDVTQANFEGELLGFIQNPFTKLILQGSRTHLEIKREYE